MATPEPDVHVWVRTAVDWQDEHGPGGQVNDAIRPRVELWNALFTLSYHEFRYEVSEIARLNLSRIRGATTEQWDDIPDGALVLPVDDDDWFAPDAAEVLAGSTTPPRFGYRWAGDLPRAADGLRSSRAPRTGSIPRRGPAIHLLDQQLRVRKTARDRADRPASRPCRAGSSSPIQGVSASSTGV